VFGLEKREVDEDLIREIRVLTRTLLKIYIEPSSSSLGFQTSEGVTQMPLTVTMGDKPGSAAYQEFNAAGNPVKPLGTVQYASDNTAVATVDPSSGALTYIGPGTCNIAAADSGVAGGLPASDSLTVNPSAVDNTPVKSTMTLKAGT
jgi:hypothetical protein